MKEGPESSEDELAFDISENLLFKGFLFVVSVLFAIALQLIGMEIATIVEGVSVGPFETLTASIAIAVSLGHFIGRTAKKGIRNSLIAYGGLTLGLGVVLWNGLTGNPLRYTIPIITAFIAALHLGRVFDEDVKLQGLFSYFDSLNKFVSYGAPGYLAVLALKIYGIPILGWVTPKLIALMLELWPTT